MSKASIIVSDVISFEQACGNGVHRLSPGPIFLSEHHAVEHHSLLRCRNALYLSVEGLVKGSSALWDEDVQGLRHRQ
jgi:hypothetical protein